VRRRTLGATAIGMSSDGNSTSPPAAADAAAVALSRVVPGRACDTCTLCCKVIAIEDFAKPPGVWCRHCVRGKGCGIYETRPSSCRTFFCEWMLAPSLGPEWKPERAKFALVIGDGGHLTAFVDPGFPGAWRASPYSKCSSAGRLMARAHRRRASLRCASERASLSSCRIARSTPARSGRTSPSVSSQDRAGNSRRENSSVTARWRTEFAPALTPWRLRVGRPTLLAGA
jgi:hypothetical protein